MSYTNRSDYAATGEECRRLSTCQLHDEHGGDCDSRPEQERWQALYRKLGGLLPGEAPTHHYRSPTEPES